MNGCRWILFADLDGTVLDSETYEPGPSVEALAKCRDEGIPVIFSSSKTGSEIELYHTRYASRTGWPFIAENGGGVFLPVEDWERPAGGEQKGRYWKVPLGARHEEVLKALTEAARRAGAKIRTFSGMAPEEIASRTGLSLEEAGRAGRRDFDEPFWVDEGDSASLDALRETIETQGLRLTRGGRCFHVHGASDKGTAVLYVRRQYESKVGRVCTAAVGDAANDLPMFLAADRAYLVSRADETHDPDIPRGGKIRFVPGAGPSGFLQAVEDLLELVKAERSSSR